MPVRSRLTLLAGLALAAASPARPLPADEPPRPPALDAHGDPLPAGARARLGTVRFRPGGYLAAGALSPDGKVLAVTVGQAFILLDSATGRELRRHTNNIVGGNSLSFSPDGKLLALVDYSNRIQLRDAAGGNVVAQLQATEVKQRFTSAVFSGDSRLVAAGVDSFGQKPHGEVHVWEARTGKHVRHIETMHNARVMAALSGDGRTLLTWGQHFQRGGMHDPVPAQTVQLWDIDTGKELRRVRADGFGMVSQAALSPDGKTLAATTAGSTVLLWDAQTGKEVRRLAGRRGLGMQLAFAPDGSALAAAGHDGSVQLWELPSGKRLGVCDGPGCRFGGLAFTGRGRALAWGLDSQSVCLWEVPSGKWVSPRAGHHSPVTSLRFAAGGKELLTAGLDGQILTWDAGTGKLRREGRVRDDDLRRFGYGPGRGMQYQSMTLSPDGAFACGAGGPGGSLRLWQLPSGRAVCDFEGATGPLHANAFAPDGGLVAVAGMNRSARVWDVQTGQQLRELKFPQGDVRALAFAPDGKTLALAALHFQAGAGQLGDIQVLRADTAKELWRVKRANALVASLAFSPDGKLLAVANGMGGPGAGGLELLDAATGKQVHQLEGQAGAVQALAFSPDGRMLAAGFTEFARPGTSGESGVMLWELATGRVRGRFTGHRGPVLGLAFSPDGRTLASASQDTTALLWDLTGGARPGAR